MDVINLKQLKVILARLYYRHNSKSTVAENKVCINLAFNDILKLLENKNETYSKAR